MKNPYEVLGVSPNASEEEVKSAYRSLVKKYHPDRYANTDLADLANEKMQEINEAYDTITKNGFNKNTSGYGYTNASYSYSDPYSSNYSSDYNYNEIMALISSNRLNEAQERLFSIPQSQRNSRWHYCVGQLFYKKGWLDQALTYFEKAHIMEPNNMEYANAYNTLKTRSFGGYRTTSVDKSDSVCDICAGLYCADCCCECMGGDLIPCC